MRYTPSLEELDHYESQGIEGREFEIDDDLWNLTRRNFAEQHPEDSPSELTKRVAYYLIWQQFGVPDPDKSSAGQKSVDVMNARRLTAVHEIARQVQKKQIPSLEAAIREGHGLANQAIAQRESTNRQLNDIRGGLATLSGDSERIRFQIELESISLISVIAKYCKRILWGIGIAALLIILAVVGSVLFALKAHAQVDGFEVQDSGGTRIKMWAGGIAKIKCSTNLTCTFGSGVLTMVSATGGGSPHNILSATHTDSTVGTVARGDLITGQGASPLWTRLAKGTANQVLCMDGSAVDILWCAASGGGTPCVTTALSFQYNNAGAFGCVTTATSNGTVNTFQAGANFLFTDTSDATKKIKLKLSGITTATTREVTIPDADSRTVRNGSSAGQVPIWDGSDFIPGDPLVQGVAAHDAAGAAINPVAIGCYGNAAAPADVSADVDIVRAWCLRNGSPVVNLATGGTLYDARQIRALASGTDSVAAVQSGTWTVQPGNTANTTAWLFKLDQTGTNNDVDVISSALPTGAATEATLATRLADSTFTGRINTQGQKAMAASTPVVLASDQSKITTALSQTATDNDVDVVSSALPTGAATEATLALILTTSAFQARIPTLGQKAMAGSVAVVVASDQSAIPVSGTFFQATQPVSIAATVTVQGTKTNNNAAPGATNFGSLDGVATAVNPSYTEGNLVALSTNLRGAARTGAGQRSAANSSTATLTSNSVFTGTFEEVSDFAGMTVGVFADVASATNGLCFEWSSDGTNADRSECSTLSAASGRFFNMSTRGRYFRTKFTNGVTGQATFRLETVYCAECSGVITKPLKDAVTTDNFAQSVQAALLGIGPDGATYQMLTARNQNPDAQDWGLVVRDPNVARLVASMGAPFSPGMIRGSFNRPVKSTGDALDVNVKYPPADWDPCTGPNKTNVNISLTANTRLIVGQGTPIRICSIFLLSTSAETFSIVEGTGATCATGIAAVIGSTTAANGPALAANGGYSQGNGAAWIAGAKTAGNDVCILISGSTLIAGNLTYAF